MITNSVCIPGYQTIEEIYIGSKTLVYRAIRECDRVPVVIKLLKSLAPTPYELKQFQNQYAIAKALISPGIIQVYDLEPCHNGYALVMEDFGGISLQKYFQTKYLPNNYSQQKHSQKKPRNLAEILDISIKIAEIIDFIHQKGVIHKDIKPANILISPHASGVSSSEIKLIDFSIASLVGKETQEAKTPEGLEGTLAYLSPEQTGRMSWGVDYRSDFYALGVTLFELLMGELPFQSDDPMELVYFHLTKMPPELGSEENIPGVISDIVHKLMAKNPEDRYQSGVGLKFDLQRCLQEYKATGQIERFKLGQRDRICQLNIPTKLYGREEPLQTLLTALERVQQGSCEVVLLSGYMGIGKTALMGELLKPITGKKAHVVMGKFDRLQQEAPFVSIANTYRGLIQQILSESPTSVEFWRQRFLQAVGENGQLVINVIPELELLIGKQPPVPEFSGIEAARRFQRTFLEFLLATSCPESVLVECMDNMQWIDPTTMAALLELLKHPGNQSRLVIFAYRDGEVESTHPLLSAMTKLENQGIRVTRIHLQTLSLKDVTQFVADTLGCQFSQIQPLAKLLFDKTQGNPLFLSQLLKSLYGEGLLRFEAESDRWTWDISELIHKKISANVADLIVGKLRNLPSSTQEILQLAACIGNKFDLQTLAAIAQKSISEFRQELVVATQEGFIRILDGDGWLLVEEIKHLDGTCQESDGNLYFQFQHDRVQQAIYGQVSPEQQQVIHLKIANLLLRNSQSTDITDITENFEEIQIADKSLIEITNHSNLAIALLKKRSQRDNVARLNLQAGKKSFLTQAWDAALNYFCTGLALLDLPVIDEEFNGAWEWQSSGKVESVCHFRYQIPASIDKQRYELALQFYLQAAETAFICGKYALMQECIHVILSQTSNRFDRVKAYEIQIQAENTQGRFAEAIATVRQALQDFDIYLPENPTSENILAALQEVKELIADKSSDDLFNLPVMSQAEPLAIISILNKIASTAYVTQPLLCPIIVANQVKLSIQSGNTAISAHAYSSYGVLLNGIIGDIDAGYEFGQLALKILDKFNDKSYLAKVNTTVSAVISYKHHYKESLSLLRAGYEAGMLYGDLEYVGYSAILSCQCAFFIGQELAKIQTDAEAFLVNLRSLNLVSASHLVQIALFSSLQLQNIKNWQTQSQQILTELKANHDVMGVHLYWLHHMANSYLLADFPTAVAAGFQAQQTRSGVSGLIFTLIFGFYDSLIALATYPSLIDVNQRTSLWEKVVANQQQLAKYAQHAPMNFQHKYDLVAAEQHRVNGEITEAMDLYDRAIEGAIANDYIQEAAIACERAGEFYLGINKPKIAHLYIQQAYQHYQQWGAIAKIQQLEQHYPQWFSNHKLSYNLQSITNTRSSSSTGTDFLDLSTVLKASSAISSEIVLEKLLDRLLHIVLENAGAQKGCIALQRDGELFIEVADINHDANEIIVNAIALEQTRDFPVALLQYVARTQEPLILSCAYGEPMFAVNPYMLQHQPKSVLCTPILSQGKFLGLVYLENNLIKGAFTSDRLELVNMLITQAAIAIENAKLYAREREKTLELEQKEAQYRGIFESVNDGLSIYDMETGRCIMANPMMGQIHGCTPEEYLRISGIELIHPDHQFKLVESFQAVQAGQEFQCEALVKHTNGNYFEVEVRGTQCIYNGKPHVLYVVRDISKRNALLRERQLAQEALKKSNGLLSSLIETMPDIFFAKDLQGRHIAVNSNLARLFGKSVEEIIGKTDAELLPPEVATPIMAMDRQVMDTGEVIRFEETVPTLDGDLTSITVKAPLKDHQGNVIGVVGIARDISDRKRAEVQLERKSEELEQALIRLQQSQSQMIQSEKMSALGNLVAGVAHEINNPIGFLNGSISNTKDYIQDILEHLKLCQKSGVSSTEIANNAENIDLEFLLEDLPKILDAMKAATDRIKNISTSLRTFSRADTEHKVKANIHDGLNSTLLILKYRLKADEKRPVIEVIQKYGNLPEVECFPGQLNQVFMNILANAIDVFDEMAQTQTPEELQAKPQCITITTEIRNQQALIRIQDNGKGISTENQQKIFDHLFTTKGVGKGTGLGLAIAKQIIEETHSGKLTCNSILGKGTEFVIAIPI